MCGLFGVISSGHLSLIEKQMFETLGKLSTPRGKHSTGVARLKWVPHKQETEYRIIKDVCEPSYFFNRKKWKDYKSEQVHVLLGHNRHATVGKITQSAAHPYLTDRFIGCHNGTLTDYLEDDEDYCTDSHKFYSVLNDNKKDLKSTLETLGVNSAYALTYVDWGAKLHIFRNNQRTLFIGFNAGCSTAFWASEIRFLRAAEQLHNFKFKEIKAVPLNTKMTLDYSGHKIEVQEESNFLSREVITKHEKKYQSYSNSYTNYGSNISGIHRNYNNSNIRGTEHHEITSSYSFAPYSKCINATIVGVYSNVKYSKNISPAGYDYDEHWVAMMWQLYSKVRTPFVDFDSDDGQITIHLPITDKDKKRGKGRTKTVTIDNKHWESWYDVAIAQQNEFNALVKDYKENNPKVIGISITHGVAENFKIKSIDFTSLRRKVIQATAKNIRENNPVPKSKSLILNDPLPNMGGEEEEKKSSPSIEGSVHRCSTAVPKDYVYYNRNIIDVQDANRILNSGCSGCGDPKDIHDEIWWFHWDMFLCQSCVDEHDGEISWNNSNLGKLRYYGEKNAI